VDEAGVPGMHFSNWISLWAPRNTSKEVIAKLNAAVSESLQDPATHARISQSGPVVVPPEAQSPQALAALQRTEMERWRPILKAANIRGE
jgi:tripartite-type tricarboxylate transporter receptor subunit TctC